MRSLKRDTEHFANVEYYNTEDLYGVTVQVLLHINGRNADNKGKYFIRGDFMPVRLGRYTLLLPSMPGIAGYAAVAGKKEGEGPLGGAFDFIYEDGSAGESSWEKAESVIHRDAVTRAISKAGISPEDADVIFAGDLLNQCSGTTFGIRELGIPFMGVYGACSTMALSLAAAATCVDSRICKCAVASTSSHFCSAEKQFRMPLEYGGQRTPTSQWTATAAGAAVVTEKECGAKVEKVIIGRIQDYGIKDANNMGAAMAPDDVKLTPYPIRTMKITHGTRLSYKIC